jgi:acyl-CoA synthetase (AMP-forming)/AMP-acid ligase II
MVESERAHGAVTVVETIFRTAREAPGKLAMIFGEQRVSYGDFAGMIGAARRYLGALAPPVRGVAVLCLASLFDVWVLGLALRSLGVTTLAIRSLGDIPTLALPDIGCVVVSELDGLAGAPAQAAEHGWRLISIPAGAFAASSGRGAPPDTPSPGGPSGGPILLTSGTTGVYKKILIDPATEAMNIPRRASMFGIDARSLVNLFDFGGWTSVGYNMAVCAWGVGGAVATWQGEGMHRSLASGEVTFAEVHPELLRLVLAAPQDGLRRNPAMALVVTGGALPRALWEEARARLTPRVFTCMGATEAGPFSLTAIETADDLRRHRIHPSRQVEVADEAGAPVAAGEVGAVRVRLADNVRGYLDDPEATARFFADGCFYTGDLGAFAPDGRLALHGRMTDVINLDGDKVATAPIEAALQDRLGAGGVCVFSMPAADAGEQIHIAIETRHPIDQAQLAAAIAAHFPRFRGAHVHLVAALPRGQGGKVDRGALKRLVMGAAP